MNRTGSAKDQFGRRIEYLRVSVTDKCNFRCLYCMPPEGLPWLPRSEILDYEEIAAIVAQLAPLGVSRIRLTGGEPTLRPRLEILISLLKGIPGVEDIALSTNGVRLSEVVGPYRDAGLDRINISADSLQLDRIRRISRRNLDFDPLAAVRIALSAALTPVKLNVVLMRGINDDEIEDFARLTLELPVHVRFIELMPVGSMRELTWEHVVPSDEVLERVSSIGRLTRVAAPPRGNGPAEYYQLDGGNGSVGVITPMSHTYCGTCNRVRLTADGRLRTCLFGDHSVNLRDPLRDGAEVGPLFLAALEEKPLEHQLLQMNVGGLRALSQVGG
jgi:cyclic pyranopterin phosphate synthase